MDVFHDRHRAKCCRDLERPADTQSISGILLICSSDSTKVKLSVDGDDRTATVARIIPSGSYNGGQYAMELKIENSQGLINGQYVKMSALKANTERMMIPVTAIKTYGQLDGVIVMTQGSRAGLVWVRLGKVDGDQVEVVSGLNSGDRIVLNPGTIKDGQKLSL